MIEHTCIRNLLKACTLFGDLKKKFQQKSKKYKNIMQKKGLNLIRKSRFFPNPDFITNTINRHFINSPLNLVMYRVTKIIIYNNRTNNKIWTKIPGQFQKSESL